MRSTRGPRLGPSFDRLLIAAEFATPDGEGEIGFRRVLDELPVAVYVTDRLGHITYYNDAAVRLWGVRPELGKSEWCGSWKLFWMDGRPMAHGECPMAIAIRERRQVLGMEAMAERPDGTRVMFAPYPTPLFDDEGGLSGAVNLLVDITERKRAELRAARLSSVVESSDDAIISESLEGIIESWNGGAQRLFGYAPEEAIGQPVEILMPADRPDDARSIIRRICAGESVSHYETVRRAKDGRLIDVSLSVSPVRDDLGRIVAASKIARDISDRRRAQEQQKLVLSEMKHRIKNTLAMVQSMARQTLRSADAGERSAFIGRLRSLAETHDLLTNEEWTRASLTDVASRSLSPFRQQYGARLRITGPVVWLSAEKSLLLTMAFHELATNAIKYGALSNRVGVVDVSWNSVDGQVLLVWQEKGGPPVQVPDKTGFGSRLLERALKTPGGLDLKFDPEGVVCSISITI